MVNINADGLDGGALPIFFFSADRVEPPHIHVEAGDENAKFWLEPVALASSRGFDNRELNRLQSLIEEKRAAFLEAWHEHFS